MKFIAHMGLPKTGSSAVQAWLLRRAPDLAAHGILFPATFCGDHGNCVAMIEALLDPSDAPSALIDALEQSFGDAAASKAKAMLISSEEFGHYMRSSAQMTRIQAQFARLGKALDLGVVFLRNPQDMMNSSYAQIVKVAPFGMDFDAFMAYWNSHKVFDFAANFAQLRGRGIGVRAGVFRPGVSMPQRTLELAGLAADLPPDFDFSTPRQNESIGEIGVITARLVWGQPGFDALGPAVQGLVAEQIVAACNRFTDRPFNGFDRQSLTESTAHFAPILEAVRADLSPEDHEALGRNRLKGVPKSRTHLRDLDGDEQTTVRAALEQISAALLGVLPDAQAEHLRAAAG